MIYRNTLVMRYLEGLGYDEIAEIESVSQSALRTRIQKGIELLREGMSSLLDLTDTPGAESQDTSPRTVDDNKRSEAL